MNNLNVGGSFPSSSSLHVSVLGRDTEPQIALMAVPSEYNYLIVCVIAMYEYVCEGVIVACSVMTEAIHF